MALVWTRLGLPNNGQPQRSASLPSKPSFVQHLAPWVWWLNAILGGQQGGVAKRPAPMRTARSICGSASEAAAGAPNEHPSISAHQQTHALIDKTAMVMYTWGKEQRQDNSVRGSRSNAREIQGAGDGQAQGN